ncbi:hypothetical protein HDU96_003439 [Phlyctochytrium bullatum]|nr:hypothetical protein HDU96_003439 [Phlyctochytrium bullatum]
MLNVRVTLVGYTATSKGRQSKVEETSQKYVRGVTGELVNVIKRPEHESLIADLAKKCGFEHVTTSSSISPMIKIVPRGLSAVLDAYLTPCIQRYIEGFFSGFDDGIRTKVRVEFMKSDGGLAPVNSFSGLRAILSGPAAGVVGYALTSYDKVTQVPVIGFDMGGRRKKSSFQTFKERVPTFLATLGNLITCLRPRYRA